MRHRPVVEINTGPCLTVGGPGAAIGRGSEPSTPQATPDGLGSFGEDHGPCRRCENRGLDRFGDPCSCVVGKRIVAAFAATGRALNSQGAGTPSPWLASSTDFSGNMDVATSTVVDESPSRQAESELSMLARLQQQIEPRAVSLARLPRTEPRTMYPSEIGAMSVGSRMCAKSSPEWANSSMHSTGLPTTPSATYGATMDIAEPRFETSACNFSNGACQPLDSSCMLCPHGDLSTNGSALGASAFGHSARSLGFPSIDALMKNALVPRTPSAFGTNGSGTGAAMLVHFDNSPSANACSSSHGADLAFNNKAAFAPPLFGATSTSSVAPLSMVPWPPPPLPPQLKVQSHAEATLARRMEDLASELAKSEERGRQHQEALTQAHADHAAERQCMAEDAEHKVRHLEETTSHIQSALSEREAEMRRAAVLSKLERGSSDHHEEQTKRLQVELDAMLAQRAQQNDENQRLRDELLLSRKAEDRLKKLNTTERSMQEGHQQELSKGLQAELETLSTQRDRLNSENQRLQDDLLRSKKAEEENARLRDDLRHLQKEEEERRQEDDERRQGEERRAADFAKQQSHHEEQSKGLRAEMEMLSAQRDRIHDENQRFRDELEQFKTVEEDNARLHDELRRLRTDLVKFKAAEEANARLSEELQSLRTDLVKCKSAEVDNSRLRDELQRLRKVDAERQHELELKVDAERVHQLGLKETEFSKWQTNHKEAHEKHTAQLQAELDRERSQNSVHRREIETLKVEHDAISAKASFQENVQNIHMGAIRGRAISLVESRRDSREKNMMSPAASPATVRHHSPDSSVERAPASIPGFHRPSEDGSSPDFQSSQDSSPVLGGRGPVRESFADSADGDADGVGDGDKDGIDTDPSLTGNLMNLMSIQKLASTDLASFGREDSQASSRKSSVEGRYRVDLTSM